MKMKCGFLDLTMNLVTLHQHNGKIFKLQELEAEQMIFKKRSQRLYIRLHSTGIPNHNNGLHFIKKKKKSLYSPRTFLSSLEVFFIKKM